MSNSDSIKSLCTEVAKIETSEKVQEIEKSDHLTDLLYSQVCRLHLVMSSNLCITSKPRMNSQFPKIEIQMKSLVETVRSKLMKLGVPVRDVRLNGGAASYVLSRDKDPVYNDFDLIFGVDFSRDDSSERAKQAVLQSLLEFFPDASKGEVEDKTSTPIKSATPSLGTLEEVYVHKMVKVSNGTDRWSLISLSNSEGFDVELKFVDRMRRQYEFSVDSFQIILDNLFTFYASSTPVMSKYFYPRIIAESVYGPFKLALAHLHRKLIATKQPEQIRGGGLLKYCHLIARGYRPADGLDFRLTEKYMCSRFFIDFPGIAQQSTKLESYLASHFISSLRRAANECSKYEFLLMLYTVVESSTICLMGQERWRTLELISELARQAHCELSFMVIGGVMVLSSRSVPLPTWRTKASYEPQLYSASQPQFCATSYPPVFFNDAGQIRTNIVPYTNYASYFPMPSYYVMS